MKIGRPIHARDMYIHEMNTSHATEASEMTICVRERVRVFKMNCCW